MERLGRYELDREIGRGAMGVVYLARDTRLERDVALKVWTLPAGLDDSQLEEARVRFVREAQAAARLVHPAIVTVYDVDRDDASDLLYIAMEFVEGETLDRIVAREGNPRVERSVAIVGTLADALATAHEAGIVHRDVKPANVLVRKSDGAVKLTDFGVALVDSSRLTRPGMSIGSPAYMSPEQARGHALDGRSDLFSLASILYELLTGRRAFPGEEPTAVLYSVVHERVPPPSQIRHSIPGSLDSFFELALAKKAEDRYSDAASFRESLFACLEDFRADDGPSLMTARSSAIMRDVAMAGAPSGSARSSVVAAGLASSAPDSGETVPVRASLIEAMASADTADRVQREPECASAPGRARPDANHGRPGEGPPAAEPRKPSAGVGTGRREGPPASPPIDRRSPGEADRSQRRSPATRLLPLLAALLVTCGIVGLLGTRKAAQTWPSAPLVGARAAYVEVDGRSDGISGHLTLTVDGRQALERELDPPARRRWLQRLARTKPEIFSARLRIPAGQRTIVATIERDDGRGTVSDSISVSLEPGETRSLRLRAGQLVGKPISLTQY